MAVCRSGGANSPEEAPSTSKQCPGDAPRGAVLCAEARRTISHPRRGVRRGLTSLRMCCISQAAQQLHRRERRVDAQVVGGSRLEAGWQLREAGPQLPVERVALSAAPDLGAAAIVLHHLRWGGAFNGGG
jgi:hypothetical protein